MAEPIYLTQEDTATQFEVTFKRKDGTVVDITDGQARLRVRQRFASELAFTLNATLTDPSNGVCIFDFQGGELNSVAVGEYEGQLTYINDNDREETVYEQYNIIIGEKYPVS